jgi:HPt (histidine-containing phosphotransfer) domain-containing protein
MSEPEILNPKAAAALREWGGEKLLGQMVRLFLENSPTRMEQIRSGVEGGDLKEAERAAHSLKSSAANLGAEELRTLAADIERTAGTRDPESVRALLGSLNTAYAKAIAALETVEKGIGS